MSQKASNPKNIGIYDYDKRISRTMILIKKKLSQENISIIEQYHNVMIRISLKGITTQAFADNSTNISSLTKIIK
ncbi:hypothetical protein [Nitrosopumilus ureiphilus]|uniref:Uncharacterized protein n=1 Tax=Nitrosopumilus ureiphilus TaxID=1470067 RepID=A0A7D5R6B4_9ARCH|nr:hypothetical protein [Nitrosopumilus ureiphilus]QLH05939.1 hypothetical protein C5F50_01730 [Nitrosopumilus ureiphilus]